MNFHSRPNSAGKAQSLVETGHGGGAGALQEDSPAYLCSPGTVTPPGELPPGCCCPEQTGHTWAMARGMWVLKLGVCTSPVAVLRVELT